MGDVIVQVGQHVSSVNGKHGAAARGRAPPDGTETRLVYDEMGRVVFSTDRFASGSAYTFDNETGELTWTSNDNGGIYVVIESIYDSLGRVVGTKRYKNAKVTIDVDSTRIQPCRLHGFVV